MAYIPEASIYGSQGQPQQQQQQQNPLQGLQQGMNIAKQFSGDSGGQASMPGVSDSAYAGQGGIFNQAYTPGAALSSPAEGGGTWVTMSPEEISAANALQAGGTSTAATGGTAASTSAIGGAGAMTGEAAAGGAIGGGAAAGGTAAGGAAAGGGEAAGTALAASPVGWIAAAVLAQNVLDNKHISSWQAGLKGQGGSNTGDHFLDQWGMNDGATRSIAGYAGWGSGGGALNPSYLSKKVFGDVD